MASTDPVVFSEQDAKRIDAAVSAVEKTARTGTSKDRNTTRDKQCILITSTTLDGGLYPAAILRPDASENPDDWVQLDAECRVRALSGTLAEGRVWCVRIGRTAAGLPVFSPVVKDFTDDIADAIDAATGLVTRSVSGIVSALDQASDGDSVQILGINRKYVSSDFGCGYVLISGLYSMAGVDEASTQDAFELITDSLGITAGYAGFAVNDGGSPPPYSAINLTPLVLSTTRTAAYLRTFNTSGAQDSTAYLDYLGFKLGDAFRDTLVYRVHTSGGEKTGQTGTYSGLEVAGGIIVGGAIAAVTSVTLTQPSAGFTITGSGTPITGTGTPTFALADDLAALEALSGTNTIYYRSGASTWSAVTIGAGLSFSGGTLDTSGSSGITGSGTDNHLMRWDGTGAAQDSNIVVADTTGALSNSASYNGTLAAITNTSTGASAVAIHGSASAATGEVFGVIGSTSSSSNATYGGYFYNSAGAGGVGLLANGADFAEMTAPNTPEAGFFRVYAKSDGKIYGKNDSGTEYDLTVSNSGTVTSVSGTTNQVSVATGTTTPVISLTGPHGFTTLTSHGVLLGQGTSAITATAAMTDGQLLVGQSSADPLPKTITGDVTISAAGVTAIGSGKVTEAMQVLADNTTQDVSITKHGYAPKAPNDATKFLDGTGSWDTVKDSDLSTSDITTNNASTSKHGFCPKLDNDSTHFLNGQGSWAAPGGGSAASDTAAGIIEIAVQSEMETGTDTTRAVVPGRQQYHQSACKFWCVLNGTGTISNLASYNVTSITDNGTGDYSITIATDFSSADWCPFLAHQYDGSGSASVSGVQIEVARNSTSTIAAGSLRVFTGGMFSPFSQYDCIRVCVGGFGDQ